MTQLRHTADGVFASHGPRPYAAGWGGRQSGKTIAIHPVLEGYGRRRPDAAEPAAWADGWARLPGPVLFLIIGLTYLLLAQMVLWVNDPVRLGAGFWPAGGVTTAALLALPTRRWGWVIAAVGLAEFGGDVAHGYPLAAAAWWTIGNVVGPVVGASLVRRFVHPRGRLVPLRNLVGFLALGALAGPLVGASLGSVGAVSAVGLPVWQVWPKYVVGDALGVLVVAPALLTWRMPRRLRRVGESLALVAGLAAVPALVFWNWDASLGRVAAVPGDPAAGLGGAPVRDARRELGGPVGHPGRQLGHGGGLRRLRVRRRPPPGTPSRCCRSSSPWRQGPPWSIAALVSDLRDRSPGAAAVGARGPARCPDGPAQPVSAVRPPRGSPPARHRRWSQGRGCSCVASMGRSSSTTASATAPATRSSGRSHDASVRRTRADDLVARLSSDEFVVVSADVTCRDGGCARLPAVELRGRAHRAR